MKKSIVLIELIFTIVIISLVSIFSLTFLFSLYDKLSFDYKNEIVKIETSSTKVLLDKIFSNAKNIKITSNNISFNKIDTRLFDLGYYSRFIDLNSSNTTSSSVYSPNTKAQYLIDHFITFDEQNYYEIKNNSYGNIINLEDTNSKIIKEQYEIASINHQIIYKGNKLYLDNNILLENISSCRFTLSSNILSIHMYMDAIPFNWSYKL